jgi:hypothetical protein
LIPTFKYFSNAETTGQVMDSSPWSNLTYNHEPELTSEFPLITRIVPSPANYLFLINFHAPSDKKTEALITQR